uniref:Uncharacterized protein n=1 Tax=Zea mays TaxID=4577 RepID=A0A804R2X8_MAIZE
MHLDAEKDSMSQCVALLGKFIAVREPNIRYLSLENMTRMLLVTDVQDIIRRHQAQIITSLKDLDIRKTSCYFADIFLQRCGTGILANKGKVVARLRTELRMGLGFGGRESRRPPLAGSSSADGSTSTPPQRRHSDSSAPSPLHGCT